MSGCINKIACIAILLIAVGGCNKVASTSTLAGTGEGAVCVMNSECREGLRCNDGRCEDIYHPRKTIKNY